MNTENFTLDEFTRSDAGVRGGITNALPSELADAALMTLQMLERIRAFLCEQAGHDVPILISSGYRCAEVNELVGGSKKSDHLLAAACDWTAPSFGSPFAVCRALAPQAAALGIGQLIHEFGRWVHTSTRVPGAAANRIITISAAGTFLGVVAA